MAMQDMYNEIIGILKKKVIDKDKLARLKIQLCEKHGVKRVPTDIEILLNAHNKDINIVKKSCFSKPTRTGSGVAVVAVMSKPHKCPHGACTMCPSMTESGVPQSYTGLEPATMRAIRNRFDPYLQIFNRLEQYVVMGHLPQKVELIIMGGTFPALDSNYKETFVAELFQAMNMFSRLFFDNGTLNITKFRYFFELPGDVHDEKRLESIHSKILSLKESVDLETAQIMNEKAYIRCVGLTIETRSDHAKLEHGNELLQLGCTRVELGIQSVYENALQKINRGHSTKDNIEAIRILKDLGFKLNFHVMIGLPGVSREQDAKGLKELFQNKNYRPDMLKLYPCMVVKNSKLYENYTAGLFKPINTEEASRMIAEFKTHVPEYCRIMRVQRDIPTNAIEAGVDRTNLRQYVKNHMKKNNMICRCIRCRESHGWSSDNNVTIKVLTYEASHSTEYFISAEQKDSLMGFVRMRYPSLSLRNEITPDSALIRELHVYGQALGLDEGAKKKSAQHKGLGKRLLKKAENIARKDNKTRVVVISGVGVREYYQKLGYRKEGPYMVKDI